MRATLTAIALIFALGAARSAADTLPFSGTLSMIFGSPVGQTFSTTGSGTGTSVGGGAASIPANVFAINQGGVISPPVVGALGGFAACVSGLQPTTTVFGPVLTIPSATAACPNPLTNSALSFTGSTGTGGLNGSAYFTNTSFQTAGEIPLGVVGNGGTTTGGLLANLISFTIASNPWTTAAVTSSGVFSGANTVGPGVTTILTAAGFDNRNLSGVGALQLVTSGLLSVTGAINGDIPIVSVMTLTFVPEPGTALLLGSGIAGLVVLGRRRMRE